MDSYAPVEVTTHNLHFHEESPILSADSKLNIIATCGTDKIVRLWNVHFSSPEFNTNTYRTASNSSVRIEHQADLDGFTKPINSVRFKPETDKCVLAGCSDGGKVLIFIDENKHIIRQEDGDDAYDLCWSDNLLFVGFASGFIEVYNILFCEDLTSELICRINLIGATIQGIVFNKKHGILAVHSLNKKVSLLSWIYSKNQFEKLAELDQEIDSSKGLFRRICFNDDLLFVFNKKHKLSIYLPPFDLSSCFMKIGPFDSGLVKVLNVDDMVIACSKRSAYIFYNKKFILSVDNACFLAVTDAFMINHTIFLSSMDGFLVSIRLDLIYPLFNR